MAAVWHRRYSPAIAAIAARLQAVPNRPMSSILSDAGVHATSLDRLGSQIALDDLRGPGADGLGPAGDATFEGAARGPQVDPGEDVLTVAAWDGVPAGDRMLAGDTAFERTLAGLELSQAADRGADAVLDALV